MRITLLTLGTRGDVQPYIALGQGLQRAGYLVTLGTSGDFQDMVTSCGLQFSSFRLSIRGMLEDPETRSAFVSKRAAFRLARKFGPMIPGLLDDAWKASEGAQAIVYHPKILNGLDIGEKLSVPSFVGFYLPISPTRAFPAPFLPLPANWGGAFNRASHLVFLRMLTAPYHRISNRWRRSLGLPPRPFWSESRQRYGPGAVKLYGYSRHIVPTPPDWDDSAQVTGQWFLKSPKEWNPPSDLARFVEGSPPAVLVSFGSIAGISPERTTATVLEALRRSRQRSVLVGGWGGLRSGAATIGNKDVYFIESAPYDWLLPRVAAVVHHGGAGSTGESLRAGKPAVVCPFFGDQPFWGRRVHALGAGPRPLPQKGLSAAVLAEAILEAVVDERMRLNAESLGEKIRAEDGVGNAVNIITSRLEDPAQVRSP